MLPAPCLCVTRRHSGHLSSQISNRRSDSEADHIRRKCVYTCFLKAL